MNERIKYLDGLVDDGMAKWMSQADVFKQRIDALVEAGQLDRDEEAYIWAQIGDRLGGGGDEPPPERDWMEDHWPKEEDGKGESPREKILRETDFAPGGTWIDGPRVLRDLGWIVLGLLVTGWGSALILIFIWETILLVGVVPVVAVIILIAGWSWHMGRRWGVQYLWFIFGKVCILVCAVEVLSWVLIFFGF